ncbi:MAG TPA: 2-aminoethylphosphonate--pyruvate transaminase [Acidobacteriota bacterium]|nr:2-aminoethylphosphonate--pyruvate transaminase [Acidobacteriota bacterium]
MTGGAGRVGGNDKTLFTPGPLTTSQTTKEAQLRDLGSRDAEFLELVARIRSRLLAIGGVAAGQYEAILMQGSGTFAIESVVASAVPPSGKMLVVSNGAYGRRIAEISRVQGIATDTLCFPENRLPVLGEISARLDGDEAITHVAVVHCETSTGIVNPIREIGDLVHQSGRVYCVDAMTTFGGLPLEMAGCPIDYLISSANKCLEGVPGFAFVLARTSELASTAGYARSVSLDLLAQWEGLEANGQFRFTPPTHALLAFDQALVELAAEGGVEGRAARYRLNHETLLRGMREMGFKEYLPPDLQSYIITSFRYPSDARFEFDSFYCRLADKGFVIYPGKLSDDDCFRIGTIGHIFPSDVTGLLAAIEETLQEMGIDLGAGKP